MKLDFTIIKNAVEAQLQTIVNADKVFRADTDKDVIWDTYLSSFPEGSNPIYRERTEHDCSCCKQFIREVTSAVTFDDDGNLVTAWDIDVSGEYQVVADAMSDYIKSCAVKDVFLTENKRVGQNSNVEILPNGKTVTHTHFFCQIPNALVSDKYNIPSKLGELRTNKEMLQRALEEITQDSIDTVLDLIVQGSLYRGEEKKNLVVKFDKVKKQYSKLTTEKQRTKFFWETSLDLGMSSRIRNDVIGTLLTDLSTGVDLEVAVKKFEDKVAPHNYKRTTALITPKMIKQAEDKVEELGITDALQRRYATKEDLSITNVLFADNSIKPLMKDSPFDLLTGEVKKSNKSKSFDKVEEISDDDFINNILPRVNSVEMFVENHHKNNFVSLIAPVYPSSGSITKWGNNFTWSYNGEVTDSIKEKVKAAGGNVVGEVRFSLAWFNYDDLDLHLITPQGKIYFSNKKVGAGQLDVDMNISATTRSAVENIFYNKLSSMPSGNYELLVHNHTKRENENVGFTIQCEIQGDIKTINYPKAVRSREKVSVMSFTKDSSGIKITKSLPSEDLTQNIWGIDTQNFQKVDMIMNSPNHWDGEQTGNRHLIFILDKCKNPETSRGFYNEFLRDELCPNRKVFEVLGRKMVVSKSDNQLSGLGFSSTQRNSVVLRLKGSFERVVKVVF